MTNNILYFQNNGEFDVDTMMTFGISAKDTKNPIGLFGTGLKYAIAIILRLGGSISIQVDERIYQFEVRTCTVRGKSFDIVYIDGHNAGFTTHLGEHWDAWMAFRELYCNTIDEDGVVGVEEEEEYDVTVMVDCPELLDTYTHLGDYFIDKGPHHTSKNVEFRSGCKPYIYYRGIAITDAKESICAYNILSKVDLTEDRTPRFLNMDVLDQIACAIQISDNKDLIYNMLTSKFDFDQGLAYDYLEDSSEEFLETCDSLMSTNRGLPLKAQDVWQKHRRKEDNWPIIPITSVMQSQLAKAIEVLDGIDVNIDDYPVKVVKGLGEGAMGRAHRGEILLSEMPFNMGTKQVASTLLEEWVHCKFGCKDFDREMQDWLFDKILTMIEQFNGEPI